MARAHAWLITGKRLPQKLGRARGAPSDQSDTRSVKGEHLSKVLPGMSCSGQDRRMDELALGAFHLSQVLPARKPNAQHSQMTMQWLLIKLRCEEHTSRTLPKHSEGSTWPSRTRPAKVRGCHCWLSNMRRCCPFQGFNIQHVSGHGV